LIGNGALIDKNGTDGIDVFVWRSTGQLRRYLQTEHRVEKGEAGEAENTEDPVKDLIEKIRDQWQEMYFAQKLQAVRELGEISKTFANGSGEALTDILLSEAGTIIKEKAFQAILNIYRNSGFKEREFVKNIRSLQDRAELNTYANIALLSDAAVAYERFVQSTQNDDELHVASLAELIGKDNKSSFPKEWRWFEGQIEELSNFGIGMLAEGFTQDILIMAGQGKAIGQLTYYIHAGSRQGKLFNIVIEKEARKNDRRFGTLLLRAFVRRLMANGCEDCIITSIVAGSESFWSKRIKGHKLSTWNDALVPVSAFNVPEVNRPAFKATVFQDKDRFNYCLLKIDL
jgi:ribosomal protein S18 acetylase RimI-like enzyme